MNIWAPQPTQKKIDEELNWILDQIQNLKQDFLNKGWDLRKLQELGRIDLLKNFNTKAEWSIKKCIDELTLLYGQSFGQDWNTLLFVHNEFAFGRNAVKLAQNTRNLLSNTKDIELSNSTGMRGNFKFKLLKPYNWIEYVECQIIKYKA
jgi:hypothetical protein